jgi:hypothetical protein
MDATRQPRPRGSPSATVLLNDTNIGIAVRRLSYPIARSSSMSPCLAPPSSDQRTSIPIPMFMAHLRLLATSMPRPVAWPTASVSALSHTTRESPRVGDPLRQEHRDRCGSGAPALPMVDNLWSWRFLSTKLRNGFLGRGDFVSAPKLQGRWPHGVRKPGGALWRARIGAEAGDAVRDGPAGICLDGPRQLCQPRKIGTTPSKDNTACPSAPLFWRMITRSPPRNALELASNSHERGGAVFDPDSFSRPFSPAPIPLPARNAVPPATGANAITDREPCAIDDSGGLEVLSRTGWWPTAVVSVVPMSFWGL